MLPFPDTFTLKIYKYDMNALIVHVPSSYVCHAIEVIICVNDLISSDALESRYGFEGRLFQ